MTKYTVDRETTFRRSVIIHLSIPQEVEALGKDAIKSYIRSHDSISSEDMEIEIDCISFTKDGEVIESPFKK